MGGLTCFKAYDVRGRLGVDLDAGIARRIGRAFATALEARRVVVGRDCRLSSPGLLEALAEGLAAAGVEVLDLGLCGTEEVYFATAHLEADGGICVTASHNPADYNGMKLVGRGAAPIAPEGLEAIRGLAERAGPGPSIAGGTRVDAAATRAAYVARVLSFVDMPALPPLRVLVNCGNGAAGPTLAAVARGLAAGGARLDLVAMHAEPDGRFPNGIPNPLLPENRPATAAAVVAEGADLGVAFDGDFDRCFLFDHRGRFVPGEYVVGLLAEAFLVRERGATIVHDPRVVWNTQDLVARAGGRAVQARTGHAFLKQALRDTGAVYGGEMSAHHYFRDFMACDSGMIPWLLVVALIGARGRPLADLLAARIAAFPSSGEINFRVDDVGATLARVRAALAPGAAEVDEADGLSLAFGDWRFNLRGSNTEPLLRLNVEARGDAALVEAGVARLRGLIAAG
jgi:phosphomannomutase